MKKRWMTFLLALVMILSLPMAALAAGIRDEFGVTVVSNYWYHYTAFGDDLYVPYLKIEVKNNKSSPASKITVKAVFYNETQKSLFDEQTNYLISGSDTPLKSGYSKTAFITAGVGYKTKISELLLPDITAEIYINDEYYGTIEQMKTYAENAVSIIPGDIWAINQEDEEKKDGMSPEELINERCSFLCNQSANDFFQGFTNFSIINTTTNIQYDGKSGKFACIADAQYTIYALNGNYACGYAGHVEGTNIVIEKNEKLYQALQDSAATEAFWSTNWN